MAKAEYKQEYFDISNPPLKIKVYAHFIGGQPSVELNEKIIANERVRVAIEPFLAQGWELDGTWDTAVDIDWEYTGAGFPQGHKYKLRGAAVKFRRHL